MLQLFKQCQQHMRVECHLFQVRNAITVVPTFRATQVFQASGRLEVSAFLNNNVIALKNYMFYIQRRC